MHDLTPGTRYTLRGNLIEIAPPKQAIFRDATVVGYYRVRPNGDLSEFVYEFTTHELAILQPVATQ